jgi:hypothetical protein
VFLRRLPYVLSAGMNGNNEQLRDYGPDKSVCASVCLEICRKV